MHRRPFLDVHRAPADAAVSTLVYMHTDAAWTSVLAMLYLDTLQGSHMDEANSKNSSQGDLIQCGVSAGLLRDVDWQ